jgi:hypothetical protein
VNRPDADAILRYDRAWGDPDDQRLSAPVLVVGLEGWVDAGMGSSAAVEELITSLPTQPVASFDTELLIDQRARRPIARLENGVTTELTWPAIRVTAGKDRVGADIVYLTVGLGAFPAPTPHTRPVKLASTVPPQSADLVGRVGTVQGTLEVPAGVQAALEVALGQAEVPVIGLWARVPHYVSAMPYPEASAALIEGLCAVTGLVLDSSSLRRAGDDSRRQVDELIGANPEHLDMVRRLEMALDSEQAAAPGLDMNVPSGDEIAAELEQFLRGEGH